MHRKARSGGPSSFCEPLESFALPPDVVLQQRRPQLQHLLGTLPRAREGSPRGRECRARRSGLRGQLNDGFRQARHELVAVTDADTHMHPQALKMLVARMCRSPLLAAIAGAPHVTNRGRFLLAMQTLEAASIIGLIRRTQSLTGRVVSSRASSVSSAATVSSPSVATTHEWQPRTST
jgi:Glycosyl transferase family 2